MRISDMIEDFIKDLFTEEEEYIEIRTKRLSREI